MKKKMKAALLTMAIVCQTLCGSSHVTEAVPAVTQTNVQTECTYDAGYQMGEWFALIEGGTWKETLGQDTRVVFYNAKTKESRVCEVFQNGEQQFDSIEPVYYAQNGITYMRAYYRITRGGKQALLQSDGNPYGGALTWYDSVEVRGTCVIVTQDGTRQVLREVDGVVSTVVEALPEEAEFTYQDGYYFLTKDGKTAIYDANFDEVECTLPDGYLIDTRYDKREYKNYAKYGYAVIAKEVSPSQTLENGSVTPAEYEFNVMDRKGNLLLEQPIEGASYDVTLTITEDYIWDGNHQCLYSTEDLQVVFDRKKVEQDFAEYLNADSGWEVSHISFDNGVISVDLKTNSSDYKYFVYSEADKFSKAAEGKSSTYTYVTDEEHSFAWSVSASSCHDGGMLNRGNNTFYNFQTGDSIELPIDENYITLAIK